MLMKQLNQVSISKDNNKDKDKDKDEENVSKSNTEETERKQRKGKKESTEETPVKKKRELKWKPEDCAQTIGKLIKFTGQGVNKKCHYEKFEFHGNTYRLEDSVLLVPENENQKPYVAIIKDIYVQGKEGYVKLKVQWFYRPEEIENKYIGNWESKDARDIFYSFHCDEVFAESVKHNCLVYFVQENEQIPNGGEHHDFIVQYVYDFVNKKLSKFSDNEFNEQQKHEIDLLLAKTISRVGDLLDNEKDKKSLNSRDEQFVPKRFIKKVETTSPESSNMVNELDYRSILEDFDMLTGDLERDKRLEEIMRAVKQASDYGYLWPNDVVNVLQAIVHAFHDSLAKDIPKYNHKMDVLDDKLKNLQILTKRLLNGELKPEQFITMTCDDPTYGLTLNEITTVVEKQVLKIDDPSTSKSV